MSKFVYAVEGLDRLGKSTLIQGIQEKLGFFQVIHFGKPARLKAYDRSTITREVLHSEDADPQLFNYQQASFRNSMKLSQSGARIIFDRWHLGEAVYSPMYRGYDGNYVFDLEKRFKLDDTNMVRLILLTEDFTQSRHFLTDGASFDDTKREAEQSLFRLAFDASIIRDKRIINVTDQNTGLFRTPESILEEALA